MFTSTFKIHTFEEEIEFIQGLNKTMGKDIGLYVETKDPWFHKQEGKDISKATLEVLKKYGYTTKDSNVIFQTFDYPDLKYVVDTPWFHKQEGKDISKATLEVLKKYGYTTKDSNVIFQTFDYPDLKYVVDTLMPKMDMSLKTVALIGKNDWGETYELKDGKWEPFDFNYLLNPKNYPEIAKYATGLGPTYEQLFNLKKTTKDHIVVNDLVKNAHINGMIVHPYTVRADALPKYCTDVNELYQAILIDADADGLFTDFPDLGVNFLNEYAKTK